MSLGEEVKFHRGFVAELKWGLVQTPADKGISRGEKEEGEVGKKENMSTDGDYSSKKRKRNANLQEGSGEGKAGQ